jgi:AmmeMemoRadiSam system protein B
LASRVRKPAVAGSWYPGDRPALAGDVDSRLAAAPARELGGRLVGLVSPHAGMRYSGAVAAEAYALLRGRRSLVVVLVGPAHRVAFDGVAVYAHGAFETPLGMVRVAEDVAATLLAADPQITSDPWPHREEHSLEMQLPFLQRVVPDARIVPVLLGAQTRAEVEVAAAAIAAAVAGRDAVVVASTDLSHYHPAPRAAALDARITECVARLDADLLMARLEAYRGHACGGGALAAAIKVARALGASRGDVLRYADSGDVAGGDKNRVVGYMAAAFTAAPPA